MNVFKKSLALLCAAAAAAGPLALNTPVFAEESTWVDNGTLTDKKTAEPAKDALFRMPTSSVTRKTNSLHSATSVPTHSTKSNGAKTTEANILLKSLDSKTILTLTTTSRL